MHRIPVSTVQEVVPAALQALLAAPEHAGVRSRVTDYPFRAREHLRSGTDLTMDDISALAEAHAILFGALGKNTVDDSVAAWGLVLNLRQAFDQYVSLQPVVLLPGDTSPLRNADQGIDFSIVRENHEGEPSGHGGVSRPPTADGIATEITIGARYRTESTARYTFEQAAQRRGHVTHVTKSNAIRHAFDYWDQVTLGISKSFPHIAISRSYVDAAAAALVTRPEFFYVILAASLNGGLLEDLREAMVGGIAFISSTNVDSDGGTPSLCEPIHGSAPDTPGRGIANRTAAMLSAAMLLEDLGEDSAVPALRDADESVLTNGYKRPGRPASPSSQLNSPTRWVRASTKTWESHPEERQGERI